MDIIFILYLLIHRWTFVFLLGYLLFNFSWIILSCNFQKRLLDSEFLLVSCVCECQDHILCKESYLRKALDSVPLLLNIINSFENKNKNKTKQKVDLNVFQCCLPELFVPVFLFPQRTWNILALSINLIILSTFVLILYLLSYYSHSGFLGTFNLWMCLSFIFKKNYSINKMLECLSLNME